MENRLNTDMLLTYLAQWDRFLKRKVHCIACGGTAMTLLGIKASTRDVDFMVPDKKEYDYLTRTISQLGYKNVRGAGWARTGEPFIFDLFAGNHIHTTELLMSPLEEGRHALIKELAHIYVGVLNDYDLIVSKLFRGDAVDFQDTLQLMTEHESRIDLKALREHFFEMLKYHSVGEDRIKGHWDTFETRWKKEKGI